MAEQKRKCINYKNDDKPLDINQNRFVNAIIGGSSVPEALLEAYPHTKKLTSSQRSACGNKLKRVPKISKAIEDRLKRIQQASDIEAKWERSDSIRTLKNVIDMNKNELDRINSAFEQEAETILKAVEEEKDPVKKSELMYAFIKQQKARRISKIHNSAIIESVSELNKMQGYNMTNFDISGNAVVQFVGEDEIPD